MDILPLGCQAGMPSNGTASSGYLVRHEELTFLLDAGPGTALGLSRQLGDRALSAVFISHQHSDHLLDILPIGKMLLGRRLQRDEASGALEVDETMPRVPLFVPRGVLSLLTQYAALFPVTTHPLLDRAFDLGFDVHEYEPGETRNLGTASFRFELLRHAAANCGIRIDTPDASLVYSGDTGVTDALAALARGAGTLLCESTLRETETGDHGHLSSQEAGRAASDSGVADLILTHFSTTDPIELAWHRDRASAEFGGRVRIAQPDRSFTVASTRKALA